MILKVSQLSPFLLATLEQLKATVEAACKKKITIEMPDYLDVTVQLVPDDGVNAVSRENTTAGSEEITVVTSGKDTTTQNQTQTENRLNSGGTESRNHQTVESSA